MPQHTLRQNYYCLNARHSDKTENTSTRWINSPIMRASWTLEIAILAGSHTASSLLIFACIKHCGYIMISLSDVSKSR